jgi:hypothetical protein
MNHGEGNGAVSVLALDSHHVRVQELRLFQFDY